jgi:hypothetical protein
MSIEIFLLILGLISLIKAPDLADFATKKWESIFKTSLPKYRLVYCWGFRVIGLLFLAVTILSLFHLI